MIGVVRVGFIYLCMGTLEQASFVLPFYESTSSLHPVFPFIAFMSSPCTFQFLYSCTIDITFRRRNPARLLYERASCEPR